MIELHRSPTTQTHTRKRKEITHHANTGKQNAKARVERRREKERKRDKRQMTKDKRQSAFNQKWHMDRIQPSNATNTHQQKATAVTRDENENPQIRKQEQRLGCDDQRKRNMDIHHGGSGTYQGDDAIAVTLAYIQSLDTPTEKNQRAAQQQ